MNDATPGHGLFVAKAPVDRTFGPEGSWEFLFDYERTGGGVLFADALLPPGTPGPARHVHANEDEPLFVIEGVLTVEVGDHRFEADAGSLVWLPRQQPHAFANLANEPCRLFAVCVPGTRFFHELGQYFAALAGPPDPRVLEEMGAKYGVTILGGPLTG